MCSIANKLTLPDRCYFRLTCQAWRALPVDMRVELSHAPGWEASAQEIRRHLPEPVVVICSDTAASLGSLCQSKHCDKVLLVPDGEQLWQWRCEPIVRPWDKVFKVLPPLQALAQQLQDPVVSQHVQLQLRIRGGHLSSQAMLTALDAVKTRIFQLRIVDGVHTLLSKLSSLHNLQILEFNLMAKSSKVEDVKQQLQSLPHLSALYVHTQTRSATDRLGDFLKVLPALSRVTSLKVASQSFEACLTTSAMRRISILQLSRQIVLDKPLAGLQTLRLEDFGTPSVSMVQAEHLQHSTNLVHLILDRCSAEALLHVPATLQQLILFAFSEQTSVRMLYKPCFVFAPGLLRLVQLQVLCIGCFLTEELVQSITGAVLPRVHTFGFQLPCMFSSEYEKYTCFENCSNKFVLTPAAHVVELASVFPNIQTFRVAYCGSLQEFSNKVRGSARLKSWFMTEKLFPRLGQVTCCCQNLDLELDGVSPSCRIVYKYQSRYVRP